MSSSKKRRLRGIKQPLVGTTEPSAVTRTRTIETNKATGDLEVKITEQRVTRGRASGPTGTYGIKAPRTKEEHARYTGQKR